MTVTSSHDTTIYGGSDEVEFGDGAGLYFFAGFNADGEERRGLLSFDLTGGIPPGSTITSASLRLVVTRTQPDDEPIEIHRVTASWGEGSTLANGNEGGGTPAAEGDATWNHRVFPTTPWAAPGGDFDPSASATTTVGDVGATAEWSGPGVVNDVQGWLDGPTTNFGWILSSPTSAAVAKRFGSHEGPDSDRPQLIVTFTPPASPVGACCGAHGFCGYTLDPGTSCGGLYQGSGSLCGSSTCPPPTAACCTPDVTAACSVETQNECGANGGVWSESVETCDANPCPVVLTPFVDPLPLLSVASPSGTAADGTVQYQMSIVRLQQKLHRDLPPTTVWGVSDGAQSSGFPGPTIEARAAQPLSITWVNDLRDASGALLTAPDLAVDTCPFGAAAGPPRAVIHLHGGHVPADSDGQPDQTLGPGDEATYSYPNNQPSATLWYHDDSLGVARLNSTMGIGGYYLLRDDAEDALGLPSGKYEVPLVIEDRSFLPDGSIRYPADWQETFFGNTILVNGKVWPYLNVDRAMYRFRLLNASTSRTFTLALSPGLPMLQIGGDNGLLRSGYAQSQITLGPGERADVVVDFGSQWADPEYVLTNVASAPFPNGDANNSVTNVMKFSVTSNVGPRNPLPTYYRAADGLDAASASGTRDIVLERSGDGCGGGTWTIDDLAFGDITERPHLGTTEIWRFINRSGSAHTMHVHLIRFQVLDRQLFTLDGDNILPTGTPTPPDPGETGWKDTVMVYPYQIVRIIASFNDYLGRFSYGSAMLEQEDHNMLRQFETAPPCGDGGCPSVDGGTSLCDGSPCLGLTLPSSGCGCEVGDRLPASADAVALVLGAALFARLRPRRRSRDRRLGVITAVATASLFLAVVPSCSSPGLPAHHDAGSDAVRDGAADMREDADGRPADGSLGSEIDGGIDASSDGDVRDAHDATSLLLPFGATCVSNNDCQTALCYQFGDGTSHCTEPCTASASCPAGSQGQKCNGKGYCAY